MIKNKVEIIFFLILLISSMVYSQDSSSISEIIEKIQELEQNKDPKCYATANRLEDFMYGTPLDEEARSHKINIQKELIYYLKEKATEIAKTKNNTIITKEILTPILSEISEYSLDKNGNYQYILKTGTITILKKDYNQYGSVSYSYRSLLSVEQDLTYFSESNLFSFDSETLQIANDYVNLLTLVTLKIADINARKANEKVITKNRLQDTWILILKESKNKNTLATNKYPKTEIKQDNNNSNNELTREIIKQKIASYNKYNQLAENVFLRNIQVYFARQKWPIETKTSNNLRNYYLESLIEFTKSLIQESNNIAIQNNSPIIRVENVQSALHNFLPSKTNNFEDVTYFPNDLENKVTIESYDLDAFRDSGFHWRILGYALDDIKNNNIGSLDPNASEQLVEGIAQLGVLVLRIAGNISHQKVKTALDVSDISNSFENIQTIINNYDFKDDSRVNTTINSSSKTTKNENGFQNITDQVGIDFEHKSSDWLNRLIRSYTVSKSEGAIKMAIPPAFGGSGVACEDINNDGLIDVLLLGGFGNKLYLNTKEGKFKDITNDSNLNHWNSDLNSFGEVRQPIIADFNNDGKQDIFISYVNESNKIYKNIDGVSFQDLSSMSNLGGDYAVAGPATAFDYNNDGLLDIYIGYFGNYLNGILPTLKRDNNNGMPNKLYKNIGDFKFEEVAFTNNEEPNKGWTQALGHTDINQDGLQDIIVGNDFGKNKYYINSKDGIFTENSKELKTDKPSYTMNVGITDLNGDLYPDLYISNIVVMQKDEKYVAPNQDTQMKFDPDKMANIRTIEANDLFISNKENNSSMKYALSSNIGRGYSATGWSWDADFFDFDNDGDQDLYCLNGMNDFSVYSSENPFYFERQKKSTTIRYAKSNREKNVFFVNENGELINKAEELGADLNSNARSASYFDFDNDGDLDIIINNYHEKATLLENKNSKENNWLKIKLIGDPSKKINIDAIGSSIVLNSKSNKNLWREIHSTSGYLSVHPKEQHFGLGNDQDSTIEVRWSNGKKVVLKNLISNKRYRITYPNKVEQVFTN
jgi:hypothetical protein